MANLLNYQFRTVTTPRGTNVGQHVKEDLINARLYGIIDIKTINSTLDKVNKSIVTVIEYKYKS